MNMVLDGLVPMLSIRAPVMWVVIGLVCLSGCGKSGPDVQMVEGVITLDGSPLQGATVGFTPLVAGKGLPATGGTRADGTFTLTATRGGRPDKGTTVGEYGVTVSKIEFVPDPKWDNQERGKTPMGQRKYTHVVPEAYESIATSGLKTTVKRGFNRGEAFRFDLKSDSKPE